MATTTTSRIEFRAGSSNLYRVTETRQEEELEPLDSILSRIMPQSAVAVGPIASNTGNGRIRMVKLSPTAAILWSQLSNLHVTCEWREVDGVMVPHLNSPDGVNRSMSFTRIWSPPSGCQIYFMVEINGESIQPRLAAFSSSESFPRGFYRFPLPNTFEDCRVCLGATLILGDNDSYASAFLNAFSIFNRNPFSSDLNHMPEQVADLFRFKPDGSQVPFPEGFTWQSYCRLVASTAHDKLFLDDQWNQP